MKSPEKIKRALNCSNSDIYCDICEYASPNAWCCNEDELHVDALTYISQLESQIKADSVRHGRWIEPDYVYFGAKQYICDQCKDDEYWKKRYHNYKENYCPHCGAKMDGEK